MLIEACAQTGKAAKWAGAAQDGVFQQPHMRHMRAARLPQTDQRMFEQSQHIDRRKARAMRLQGQSQ